MRFHLVVRFPALQGIKIFLEGLRVGDVCDFTIQKAVLSKKADFGAGEEIFVYVVYVDEEKRGPSTVPWAHRRRLRVRAGRRSGHRRRLFAGFFQIMIAKCKIEAH